MKKTTWISGAVVLALVAGGGWWWSQRSAQAAVQYRTATIERGPLQASVSASGTVNPVTQVSVGTQVSGQVRAVYVDFNTEVKAGQLIAEIDPQTFEYRLSSSQADLDASRAAVQIAVANSASSRANVSRAQSDLAEAQRTHERNVSLVGQGFIAQSEADRTRAVLVSAQESLKAVQALVGVSEAQIKSAQANVAQREAAVAQARIDLSRTRITSPVDGIVIKRTVEKGQTVAASLQAPELFVIAQNLSDMQVDASIDEADVGRIRAGQKASFTVDAFPGQNFEGQVRQVRKAATNVSNVVTYVAVVGFANESGRLLPGMTANVRVVTESRESVLKVPNAALRVRIAGVEPAAVPAGPTDAPAGAAAVPPGNGAANGATNGAASGAPRAAGQGRPGGSGRGASQRGRIYLLDAKGKPQAYDVRLGVSDGTATELMVRPDSPNAAALVEGATVVTGVTGGAATSAAPARAAGPRMPF
ncbi:MAG: efflux RND transporter periplasmic adaptor subunit [Hydrogenophaga sp.]|uniref:efflux RND transporter periplasmic adaptor subunit n=1 Tax=Hydrogenophaga sp. TaxID=1904254 RepID=UPI002AB98324|nr:efflux RND transporter periplasmic adaptor subunit [Hydrogenophaga sp.]MDZ4100908.1 efflux RND transporter periplasmic adaptor subunit [Hydrogenophaga sp.]